MAYRADLGYDPGIWTLGFDDAGFPFWYRGEGANMVFARPQEYGRDPHDSSPPPAGYKSGASTTANGDTFNERGQFVGNIYAKPSDDGLVGLLGYAIPALGALITAGGAFAALAPEAAAAAAPSVAATTPAALTVSPASFVELAPDVIANAQAAVLGPSIAPDVGALSLSPTGAAQAGAAPWLSNAPAGSVFSYGVSVPAVSGYNLGALAVPGPSVPSVPSLSSVADKAAAALSPALAPLAAAAKKLLAAPAKPVAPGSAAPNATAAGNSVAPLLLLAGLFALAIRQ